MIKTAVNILRDCPEWTAWMTLRKQVPLKAHYVPFSFAPHAAALEVWPNTIFYLPKFMAWSDEETVRITAHEAYHFIQFASGQEKKREKDYDYNSDPMEIEARDFAYKVVEQWKVKDH